MKVGQVTTRDWRRSSDPMPQVDVIRIWFSLLEETFGTSLEFFLGKVTSRNADPDWIRVPHRHYDGIGAMMVLLEQQGMVIEDYPRIRHSTFPNWSRQLLMKLRSAFQQRRFTRHHGSYPWKIRHDSAGRQPCGVSWFTLSPVETAALGKHSMEMDASLNTFLLWTLNRSIPRALLRDPTRSVLWRIPVNLRGPYLLNDITANHVGSVFAEMDVDISAKRLHRSIRSLLHKDMHWAGLIGLRNALSRRMTREQTEDFARRYAGHGIYRAGTFTNLGDWPGDYAKPSTFTDETRAWLVVAPPSVNAPISASVISWHGCPGVLVNYHPSLVTERDEAQRLTSLWLCEILRHLDPNKHPDITMKTIAERVVYQDMSTLASADTITEPSMGSVAESMP